MFDLIRELFATTAGRQDARGYKASRFSFNVKGGRCEACQGDGIIKIEMHFLPDVYVPCEVCKGKRYNRETLEVKYKGKNIYDVLEMTVEEALDFFRQHPEDRRGSCRPCYDVGLGYVKAGTALHHAVRRRGPARQAGHGAVQAGHRDAPSTSWTSPPRACTWRTCSKLIEVLQRLADAGNTVVVIEHNLDVIKTADYIIDLGPEGGAGGGTSRGGGNAGGGRPVSERATPGSILKKML